MDLSHFLQKNRVVMCNCACFQEKYCKVYITRGAVSELLNTQLAITRGAVSELLNTQLALASNDLRSEVLTICKTLHYITSLLNAVA